MEIQKITIVPASLEVDKSEIEPMRQKLIKDYSGKVYFETTGEVVADCVIEKELKQVKKN
jgi:hypothetical protein